MPLMSKQAQMIGIGALVILVIGIFAVALQRGAVRFEGWKPVFDLGYWKNPMPSVDRPISFPADFPETGKDIYISRLDELKTILKEDPAAVYAWLDLAIHYRVIGDDAGAVEIWQYIATAYPADAIALHNLGEYYFHVKKDYPEAEAYYLRSIANDPSLTSNYTDLFDMYVYVYKQDTNSAVDILERGIGANEGKPASIDLLVKLGEYYANKGEKEKARESYTKARAGAQGLINLALVRELDQRLSRLR